MSNYMRALTNEREYQLLREKFIRCSGSRLIFSNQTTKQNPEEKETVVGGEKDWLQDIYTAPTINYYL